MTSVSHPTLPVLAKLAILAVIAAPLALAIPPLLRAPRGLPAGAVTPEPEGATDAIAMPQTRAALPDPLVGFAVNAHHISDLPQYLDGIDRIADLGANSLLLVTPMYQKNVSSTSIRHRPKLCPTESQLLRILEWARERNLFTILMPIVLVEKPGEKDWRGVIQPHDWDAWWTSYDRYIDRFTAIARTADVDMLVIGSELNSTEAQMDRWTAVAERVRARYGGYLSYSANWDRYDKVELWPLVDVMSVSSYFELERSRPGAPEADIVKAWQPIQRDLTTAADTWSRPLLLIEVGYPSLAWANAHPWNYVADDGTRADHAAQARCWQAFFTAWGDTIRDPAQPVLGVCGYRWDPYHAGDEYDTGYGIRGKPAQEIIRNGFATLRAPPN
jgi:hypothetical protein